MRRLALFAPLLALPVVLPGCTRPSVLVCQSVSEAGHCVNPASDLDLGREYTVFATGFGLPHGNVRFRVLRKVGNGYELLAEASRPAPESATYVTNPLRLIHRGVYHVDLVGSDGELFAETEVRVTRSPVRAVGAPSDMH